MSESFKLELISKIEHKYFDAHLLKLKQEKKTKLTSELPMNNSLSMQLCQWFHNGEESSLFIFTLKIFLLRNDKYSRMHISYVCFYSSERFYVYTALTTVEIKI